MFNFINCIKFSSLIPFDIEEFRWEETFENGVKLIDLASIAYRLKGSKYDWWYELYNHTYIVIIDTTMYLNVSFSYGS